MDETSGVDMLDEAMRRRAAIAALSDGPLHRRDLEDELGVSKTTCHRIIQQFDDEGLVERTDQGYRLSAVGEIVAREIERATRNVATANDLEPLLRAFDDAIVDLEISLFNDATVTRAQPDDPYPPINRFMELLRESETLRGLDRTSIAPLHVDEIFSLILEEGVRIEAIYPEDVLRKLVTEYEEYHRKGAERGIIDALAYDEPAFGMSLFDDRVGLRAYDEDTGTLLLFADTDNPEALSWAEDVYDEHRRRAYKPDWMPDWYLDTGLEL